MTTMSLADVESIVGDKPALVCEFPDRTCDDEATWMASVHITDGKTCWVSVLNLCEVHRAEVRYLGALYANLPCSGCGVTTISVYHEVRL